MDPLFFIQGTDDLVLVNTQAGVSGAESDISGADFLFVDFNPAIFCRLQVLYLAWIVNFGESLMIAVGDKTAAVEVSLPITGFAVNRLAVADPRPFKLVRSFMVFCVFRIAAGQGPDFLKSAPANEGCGALFPVDNIYGSGVIFLVQEYLAGVDTPSLVGNLTGGSH